MKHFCQWYCITIANKFGTHIWGFFPSFLVPQFWCCRIILLCNYWDTFLVSLLPCSIENVFFWVHWALGHMTGGSPLPFHKPHHPILRFNLESTKLSIVVSPWGLVLSFYSKLIESKGRMLSGGSWLSILRGPTKNLKLYIKIFKNFKGSIWKF